MAMSDPSIPGLDRASRINEALLSHGALAITTDASGGINLDMLIRVMRLMGISMVTCASNPFGFYHVVFSQQNARRGGQPTESSVVGSCKTSAVVDAALAALRVFTPT
jgi:hypothetical protein